jgi:hypothetical protein
MGAHSFDFVEVVTEGFRKGSVSDLSDMVPCVCGSSRRCATRPFRHNLLTGCCLLPLQSVAGLRILQEYKKRVPTRYMHPMEDWTESALSISRDGEITEVYWSSYQPNGENAGEAAEKKMHKGHVVVLVSMQDWVDVFGAGGAKPDDIVGLVPKPIGATFGSSTSTAKTLAT